LKEWKTQETRDISTKETGKKGGGALLGVEGMDMRIWWLQGRSASGDDDIDHKRPQELQISSIIEK
jgi:hypothetical protein